MNQVVFEIFFKVNKAVSAISKLNNKTKSFTASLEKLLGNGNSINFWLLGESFAAAGTELNRLVAPGVRFNQSLHEMSAITGLTGEKLNQLGQAARAMAKIFGGEASDVMRSYQYLLSQLGPDIAKTPEALDLMGKNVAVLSKLMGGDAAAATEVLTAAMNQFGVDLSRPIDAAKQMTRMMNVMAAAAREGSAELPLIKSAIENVGAVAKNAGVNFTELNAAIQVLDKFGKRGAEGGVALRNILAYMSKIPNMSQDIQTQLRAAGVDISRVTDKSLSLNERLEALAPIAKNDALMIKIFGVENQLAAQALIQNTGLLNQFTAKINASKDAAVEMAGTVMGSFSEKMKRLHAVISDLGISLFNVSKKFLPLLQASASALTVGARVMPLVKNLSSWVVFLTKGFVSLTASILKDVLALSIWAAKGLITGIVNTGKFIVSMFIVSRGTNNLTAANMRNALSFGILSKSINKTNRALRYHWLMLKRSSLFSREFLLNLIKLGAVGLTSLAGFLGKAIFRLGLFIVNTIEATAAQIGLNLAMLANPIGAIIAGLIAVGAAVYMVIRHWDKLKVWIKKAFVFMIKFNPITAPFYWGLKLLDKLFPQLKNKIFGGFKNLWDKLKNWFKKLFEKLKPIWQALKAMFGIDVNYKSVLSGLQGQGMALTTGTEEGQVSGGNTQQNYGTKISSGIEGITSGGARTKNINVNIDKLIESLTITAQDVKEGAEEMREIVRDELLRVVNSINYETV